MYLVVGYGRQDCGGYSIQVKECYLTETSLVLDTELTGPKETAASGRRTVVSVHSTEDGSQG